MRIGCLVPLQKCCTLHLLAHLSVEVLFLGLKGLLHLEHLPPLLQEARGRGDMVEH